MQYLPLVIFLLGGVMFAFAAQHVITFGPHNRAVRAVLADIFSGFNGIAAYFAIVWWHGVVLDKGGLSVIHNYFPLPGLVFTTFLLAAQVAIAQTLWHLIIKGAGVSEKETRRKLYE